MLTGCAHGLFGFPALQSLNDCRQDGNDYDQQHNFFEIVPDDWNASEEVAEQHHRGHPPHSTAYVEDEKAHIVHVRHSGHKGGEGADDRHEFGVDDRFAAMPLIKVVGPVEVFSPEDSRPAAPKQLVADLFPDQKAAAIAKYGGAGQQCDHRHHIQFARAGHNAHSEQQRVTRKKKADQQPALAEHHEKEHRIRFPTGENRREEVDQLVRIRETAEEIEQL